MLFTVLEILVGFMAMFFLAGIATYWLWLPALLQRMAKNDFFVTMVEEGTAKAIMHFGEFSRFVMSWENHYLGKDWQVIGGKPGPEKPEEADEHWMDKFLPGGLRWIGWPFANKVYHYHFQWTSLRQGTLKAAVSNGRGFESIVQQQQLEDLLISRDETPDYAFLKQDVYVERFTDTDNKDMIPLEFIAVLTAQVENPYKALFNTQQWLEQIMNFLRRYIKEYAGGHTFKELINNGADGTVQESNTILGYKTPNGKTVRDYILEEWGARIDYINLVNFKPAGARGKAYEEAAATKYTKQQEADGIRELAKAERDRLTTIAAGEADRVKIVAAAIDTGGQTAKDLRTLEALEKTGENGNMIVVSGDHANILLNPLKDKKGKAA